MNQRAATAALGAETFGQHSHNFLKFRAFKKAIGISRAHQIKQLLLLPIFARCRGDDLLRQNIERFLRNLNEHPIPRRRTHRNVARHSTNSSRVSGNQRPLGRPLRLCSARPMRWRKVAMERVVPNWQTKSTEPISMPNSNDDVSHQRFQFAALKAAFASRRSLVERLPWWEATLSWPRRAAS